MQIFLSAGLSKTRFHMMLNLIERGIGQNGLKMILFAVVNSFLDFI